MGIEIQTMEITKDLRINADRIRRVAANLTALMAQCDMFSESGMVGHAGDVNASAIEESIKTCNTTTNTAEKFIQLQRASLLTRTFLYNLADVMKYLPQSHPPFTGMTPPNPMAPKMPNYNPVVPNIVNAVSGNRVTSFADIVKNEQIKPNIAYEDFENEKLMKEFWTNTMEEFEDIYDINSTEYIGTINNEISKIINENTDSMTVLKLIFKLFYETLESIETTVPES